MKWWSHIVQYFPQVGKVSLTAIASSDQVVLYVRQIKAEAMHLCVYKYVSVYAAAVVVWNGTYQPVTNGHFCLKDWEWKK